MWAGQNGPLTISAVEQMIRRRAQRAGIGKRVYPHLLRHSFGAAWIKSGGDGISLMGVMGHATLHMTQWYVALRDEDLAEKHQRHSPAKGLKW